MNKIRYMIHKNTDAGNFYLKVDPKDHLIMAYSLYSCNKRAPWYSGFLYTDFSSKAFMDYYKEIDEEELALMFI